MRGESYDVVISSDLTRCYETAVLLVEVLGGDILTTPLLRERCFGVAEAGPSSVLTPDLIGIDGVRVVDESARPEGGESLLDLYGRVGQFVEESKANFRDARLLVITHGGTIRAMTAYVLGTSMKDSIWGVVANCSRWELEVPVVEV